MPRTAAVHRLAQDKAEHVVVDHGDDLQARHRVDTSTGYGLQRLLEVAHAVRPRRGRRLIDRPGMAPGIIARSPDAVQGVAFLVVFPLTFIANAFVPLGGLPSALQAVADYNPLSAFAAAIRTEFGNPTGLTHAPPWSLQHSVLVSLLWCLLLLSASPR